jgi:hypothetical protein
MKRSIQKSIWRRAVAIVALLIIASTGFVTGQAQQAELQSSGEAVTSLQNALQNSTEIDSPAGSPVSILDSTSLEISRNAYRKLTGSKTDSARAASYPQVTLANNSDSPVNQVLLLLTNKLTGTRTRLKVSNIRIEPHGTFTIDRDKWMLPALVGPRPEGAKDQPRTISLKQTLRYNSDRVWLKGSAKDLTLTVALVDQIDGTRWDMRTGAKLGGVQALSNYKPSVAAEPIGGAGCWCAGTVWCYPDGSLYCEGYCFNCTIGECIDCAIVGCFGTCEIILN